MLTNDQRRVGWLGLHGSPANGVSCLSRMMESQEFQADNLHKRATPTDGVILVTAYFAAETGSQPV